MTPEPLRPDPALVARIAANAAAVRAGIAAACARTGRDPAGVTLVAVTKTHPAEVVVAAVAAGLRDVGENRVQELVAKRTELADLPVAWHLIGHVQTNKARDAVRHADVVHGVDSLKLGEALARRAEAEGRVLPVLVQVNVSGEATKAGVPPDDAPALVDALAALGALRVDGLMTIASPAGDPEAVRPEFRRLRALRDACARADRPLPVLSMGMSGDYAVAVEEGATHVRVGSALFGTRG